MKFSKDSSKVLHLGRKTLLMIKSENGLSGDELCLRDGQQCRHDSSVHPDMLGCINRPVITAGLQQCPVRAAEEMGLAQFGQELAFRGHDSSFTVSVRGSRRQNGDLGAVCGGRVSDHHKLVQKRFHLVVRMLFLLRTVKEWNR